MLNLLEVGFICRCPFIDESKNSEMDRPLFVLKEKRKNDKKSNHHSENSAHIKSIHWVVFDMSRSLSHFFSLLLLLILYPSMLAHDIKRKKGKFILIGSNEKKKSQYKVKIQSTPEKFSFKKVFWCTPLSFPPPSIPFFSSSFDYTKSYRAKTESKSKVISS
jgi:hypothetical protein